MRPRGDVDDGVGPVIDLQLVRAPGGLLGAVVLGVDDQVGGDVVAQGRGRVGGGELELDPLPVRLVLVVVVVERVEEEVLQREAVLDTLLGRDVGVDRRLRAGPLLAGPLLVVAAGLERVAG